MSEADGIAAVLVGKADIGAGRPEVEGKTELSEPVLAAGVGAPSGCVTRLAAECEAQPSGAPSRLWRA
jgi:hypothetical protein